MKNNISLPSAPATSGFFAFAIATQSSINKITQNNQIIKFLLHKYSSTQWYIAGIQVQLHSYKAHFTLSKFEFHL